MSQYIDAIYDDGVLKPLVPLSLPDKTRVTLTVNTKLADSSKSSPPDQWERLVLGLAMDCGISLPDSAVSSEGLYE
jgi:predicted DNA-binding antitoxin AbrB/MazE fold protein